MISNFDKQVLAIIDEQAGQAYGLSVWKALDEKCSLGAIYAAASKLQSLDLITGEYEAVASPNRDGRRRQYWSITESGRRILAVDRKFFLPGSIAFA